jgi:hypothetical protein
MSQTVDQLAACLAAAKTQGERNKCQQDFTDSGGTQTGGKVFTDSASQQLATTQNGGKVFRQKV